MCRKNTDNYWCVTYGVCVFHHWHVPDAEGSALSAGPDSLVQSRADAGMHVNQRTVQLAIVEIKRAKEKET